MWKKFVKDYLTFSKKDRIFITLLLCIFGLIVIIPRIPFFAPGTSQTNTDSLLNEANQFLRLQHDSLNNTSSNTTDSISHSGLNSEQAQLFYFDPNYISQDEWAMLGVNKRTANSIKKYLDKGGKFKKPEDLFKIYLLDKNIAKRLVPFVKFKENENPASNTEIATNYSKAERYPESKFPAKQYREVAINSADTSAFQTFPGIGSALSNRIVRYRESLGGFTSPKQIGEVYNLPDSVFQKILPYLVLDPVEIQKININKITRQQMPKHPYFTQSVCSAIIRYREQHGKFEKISDLLNIHTIDDDFLRKAEPYLTIE